VPGMTPTVGSRTATSSATDAALATCRRCAPSYPAVVMQCCELTVLPDQVLITAECGVLAASGGLTGTAKEL
jgi:hypothetical protein